MKTNDKLLLLFVETDNLLTFST